MSHAVIMGASFAGLCAAAALAKNYDRVTLIERDPAPTRPVARKGTPQANHVHVLLARGQDILAELFPGVLDTLSREGATVADFGNEVRWFHHGRWRIRGKVDIPTWFQRRPLIDWHLLENLASTHANVELRYSTPIDGPVHANGKVTGVRLQDGEVIDADLVVDATGRGSRAPAWLAEWGYGEVPEQRVDLGITYVSGEFELAHGRSISSVLGVYHRPPHNLRGGLATRTETSRALVTLFGYHGEQAPRDLAGFVDYANTLARPDIHDLLFDAELHGPLRQHKHPFQRRRLFGRVRNLPQGFVVIGDAVCCVDPTFGQGMTVSAIAAAIVGTHEPGRSTRAIQRKIDRSTNVAWLMTSTEALRWPQAEGWRPFGASLLLRYFARVFDLASHDLHSYASLLNVMHFRAGAGLLFRPRMLWKVLFRRSPRQLGGGVPQRRSDAPSTSMELLIQTGEFSAPRPPV